MKTSQHASLLIRALCLGLAMLATDTTQAQTNLLSNLPSNDLAHGNVDNEEHRAVTFTTKIALTLTQVQLSLHNYISATDIALLSIHEDGITQPGTQIGANFTAPSSISDDNGVFTFTSTGVTLSADTTYWVVIQAGNSNAFSWNRNDPTKTPATTAYATFGDQWIQHDQTSPWEVGNNGAHSFQINGTVVPEPHAAGLVTATLLGLALLRRVRKPAKN